MSIPAEEILARKRNPGPACGTPVPFSLLKNADEQTVVGISAVLHAIDAFRLAPGGTPEPFRPWGIVAAPRFIGRDNIARMVTEFRAEGPIAVSPHAIPHRTMHSPSGALSLALGIRGPNYGAGGGPGTEAEGLLSGLSLLCGRHLPGLWLLLTRIDPLTPTDHSGAITPGTRAEAVALALAPVGSGWSGPLLELVAGPAEDAPSLTLDSLRALLASGSGSCALPGFGRLELRPAAPLQAAG